MENGNLNVTSKSNTKNIIAITAIIFLFLGLLFVTFSYFNSPKKRMVDTINKIYSKLADKESNQKLNKILENNIVGLDGETTINLSGSIVKDNLDMLDNTVIKYNYIEDKKNKTSSLDFDSSINNETLVNMYGLIKDNKMYFNLKNLINKYYHMEYSFTELLASDSMEDTEYVMGILKDILIEKLDNDSFTKSKDTLKIDGESEKVEKMSFEFNDKFIYGLIIDFATELKEDEKALKMLMEYNNLSKEEMISELNTIIDSSKNVTTSNQKYTFNMYVKDYINTVKYELVVDTIEIGYYDYKDTQEFSVSESGIKYLNVKVENNKDISGTLMLMIPFKGTYEDDKLDLTFTYMTTECNLIVSADEEMKSDSYETNSKIEIKVAESNEEYLNLVIDSKNTISKLDKINEVNVPASTNIDEISESDQTTIINKLSEMTIFKKIMNIYNENMNASSSNGLEVSGADDYITF